MTLGLKFRLALPFCSLFLFLFALPAPGQSVPDSGARSDRREKGIKAFLEEEIEFDDYLFPPGSFPSVRWKHPSAVTEAVGDVPLSAEFYDASFAPVTRPEKIGRYGAVVHGTTHDGFQVVRYVTLYCSDVSLDDYGPDAPLSVNPLPGFGIGESQWELYRRNIRRFSFGSLVTSPLHNPDAAVFLAGLSGVDPRNGGGDTPRLRDRQWWVEFKRRHDGATHPAVALPVPRHDAPSTVVTERDGKSASPFNADQMRELKGSCAVWSDSAREPLVVLVVHKGQIVFQEALEKSGMGVR